jgi:hypothetical protein
MKFVLRNQAPSHTESLRAAAVVRSTRRLSAMTKSAAIAAMVFSVSGCASADDAAETEPEPASDVTEETGVAGSVESDVQRETSAPLITAVAEDDARAEPSVELEPPVSDGEPSPGVSPRGGSAEADATEASTLAESEPAPESVPEPAAPAYDTLHVAGRRLLDTCGKPFVTRGVEQIFGEQLPQGNDWLGLIHEISDSGVNAVRILVGESLGADDVDALLDVVAEHGMVGYITPYGNDNMGWLAREDVKSVLAKHEKYIIIDAFGEPTFDDRERFVNDSIATIARVRSMGYRVPLTVTANQFGRDLPSLFELGPQIVAADPLGNTILGWQAYWGSSGYYHQHYGMSFEQALDAIGQAPFPIQLGLDRVTDFPSSETADFGTLMSATQEHGVGWLWWDWYNPYGNENNLTENGNVDRLTTTGTTVLETHPASVQNTSKRVCVR